MMSHVCVFKIRGRSAGRHIDRAGADIHAYIYDKPCKYILDENKVDKSTDKQGWG